MDNLKELYEIFAKTTSAKDMAKLFNEILTSTELADVDLRWRLMKKLAIGEPQRKIAEELKISLCKITRGSKILKDKNSIFRKILLKKEL